MRIVFGVGLGLGVCLLLALVIVGLPARARVVAAGMSAFGIAGLSAAYAGWPMVFATMAAVVAAGIFGWYAASEEL